MLETDVWILLHNIDLRFFVAKEYLSQIFALFHLRDLAGNIVIKIDWEIIYLVKNYFLVKKSWVFSMCDVYFLIYVNLWSQARRDICH